ncbi:insulinase family protein [Vibrio tapetis]|uniref:insulinase family protein n=1 Tax=Vibrio tapetis TaxID=52443 RepID=UPI000C86249F|nr:insulinase family protein [Vibrio tapetis]
MPNNAELVVVGDFDKKALVKAISDEFGSWEKRDLTAISPPAEVKVWDNEALLLDAPEGSSSGFGLFSHLRTLGDSDKLSQQEDLYIDLVNGLLSNRLKNRAFEENKLLLDIGAQSFVTYDQQYSVIYADYDEQERLTMLEFMAKELTSIRDYGFVESELYTVMSQFNSEHANIDLDETNTSSSSIANYKQNTLIDDRVYQDIADYRDNLRAFIDKVTLSDVNKRVNRLLSAELKHIYSASLADDMSEAEQGRRLRSYHLPMLAMLEQPGQKTYISSVPNELITPTSHGKVVEQKTLSENMHFWQLDNGMKVWLKRVPEAEKELYLSYAARGGIKSVDAKLNPAVELALDSFMRSGLGKFNAVEADRFLTENGITLYPILASSAQGFSMTSHKESLDNAFSALYTAATSMQVQANQLELVKKNVVNNRIQGLKSSSGQLTKAAREVLYQPNSYYQFPSVEQIKAVTVEEVQSLYDGLFRQKYGFDVVIVADMSASEVEPYLTRYLANIQYDEKTDMGSQTAKLKEDRQDLRLDISKENSVAFNLFYSSYYKTNSTRELIQLDLIYYLLETRYRNELREERGLDYTPAVILSVEDKADIASVVISLNLDTADVEKARKALNDIHKELASGFTQLELDTAKKQVSHSLSVQKDNPFAQLSWHQRAVLYGYDFEIFSRAPAILNTISVDDVNKTLNALMGQDTATFVAEMWPKP